MPIGAQQHRRLADVVDNGLGPGEREEKVACMVTVAPAARQGSKECWYLPHRRQTYKDKPSKVQRLQRWLSWLALVFILYIIIPRGSPYFSALLHYAQDDLNPPTSKPSAGHSFHDDLSPGPNFSRR